MREIVEKGEEAIFRYEQAFHSSLDDEQRKASARKNQGYSASRVASKINDEEHVSIKIFYIYQALSYYKDAYKFGTYLDSIWKQGIV